MIKPWGWVEGLPALPSLCESVLSPRWGYELTPLCTPDLRPGLHSGAAPRLKNDGIVPPPPRFLRSHTDSEVLGFLISPLCGWCRSRICTNRRWHMWSKKGLHAAEIARVGSGIAAVQASRWSDRAKVSEIGAPKWRSRPKQRGVGTSKVTSGAPRRFPPHSCRLSGKRTRMLT